MNFRPNFQIMIQWQLPKLCPLICCCTYLVRLFVRLFDEIVHYCFTSFLEFLSSFVKFSTIFDHFCQYLTTFHQYLPRFLQYLTKFSIFVEKSQFSPYISGFLQKYAIYSNKMCDFVLDVASSASIKIAICSTCYSTACTMNTPTTKRANNLITINI